MKKMLNTLFVTTEGAYLKKEGETVVVKVKSEVKMRLPIHNLGGIICFGRVLCSPALLGFCGRRSVAVSFMSPQGRFLARVHGLTSGNVLLRREQYRRAESKERSADIAAPIVMAKILNSRTSLMRAQRDHPESLGAAQIEDAVRQLGITANETRDARELETLRGMEGRAANIYFGVFDHLITGQKEFFFFRGRSRRPPRDAMNALLSFIYTLLLHDVMAALEAVGLDPQVGFLHRDRPGRPGLALDMMEEFRPFFADRLALSLVNMKQLQPKDFVTSESNACNMDDDAKKTMLVAYQKRKQEEIQHSFLGEKIHLGMVFFAQALLMARFLRGDIDGYPPFFWK